MATQDRHERRLGSVVARICASMPVLGSSGGIWPSCRQIIEEDRIRARSLVRWGCNEGFRRPGGTKTSPRKQTRQPWMYPRIVAVGRSGSASVSRGSRGESVARAWMAARRPSPGPVAGRGESVAGDGVIWGIASRVKFRMIFSRGVAMISLCSNLTTTPSLPGSGLIPYSRDGGEMAGCGGGIGCPARGRIWAERWPTHSVFHGFSRFTTRCRRRDWVNDRRF